MARVPHLARPGAWQKPLARIEGERILKARAMEQRVLEQKAKVEAEAKRVEEMESQKLDEKVDDLREQLDRLTDNIPRIIPGGGGGKRMVAKVLARDYPDVAEGFVDVVFSGAAAVETKALLTESSTSGGYWSVDDARGARKSIFINTGVIDAVSGEMSLRDGQFFQTVDRDTTDYNAQGHRAMTNAVRGFVTGRNDGGGYLYQEKDLHGGWFAAVGNTGGVDGGGAYRGQSGILASAVQLGTGVATNELAANSITGGDHPRLLCGAFGITYSGVADADSTHLVYGLAASMCGYLGTAAFRAASVSHAGQPGHVITGLKMDELTVTSAAITMPASSGNQGTIISYDTDDYTYYDRANNAYHWVVGGVSVLALNQSWTTQSPAPTVTPTSGSFTSVSSAAQYSVVGKTVHWRCSITITTNGTAAGAIDVTLPFSTASETTMSGNTRAVANAQCYGRAFAATSTLRIFKYDGTYPGSTGEVIHINGTYQRS